MNTKIIWMRTNGAEFADKIEKLAKALQEGWRVTSAIASDGVAVYTLEDSGAAKNSTGMLTATPKPLSKSEQRRTEEGMEKAAEISEGEKEQGAEDIEG